MISMALITLQYTSQADVSIQHCMLYQGTLCEKGLHYDYAYAESELEFQAIVHLNVTLKCLVTQLL